MRGLMMACAAVLVIAVVNAPKWSERHRSLLSPASGAAKLSTVSTVSGGYEGSIKEAFGAGRVPGAFSTCTEPITAKLPSSSTFMIPHTTENHAYQSFLGPGPGTAELARSCSKLAAYRLERPDPTVDGELRVQLLFHLSDSMQTIEEAVPEGQTAQAFCQITVAGPRKLAGSLLGLGLGQLPWAG